MARRVLDAACLAAVAVVVASSLLFLSGPDSDSHGASVSAPSALIVGLVVAALGVAGAALSRRIGYTNGERLGVSLAVIVAVPSIAYGLAEVTGVWPTSPEKFDRYGDATAEQVRFEETSLPLARLWLAVFSMVVAIVAGIRWRAGLALGMACLSFLLAGLLLVELTGQDPVHPVERNAWLWLVLTVVYGAAALLAERTERSMATWIHPFVIVSATFALFNAPWWNESDVPMYSPSNEVLVVAVYSVLGILAGVVSVSMQRIPWALAAVAAIVYAEGVLFGDLVPNNRIAWAISLLTGLVVIAAIAFGMIRRAGKRAAGSNDPLQPVA